MTVSEIIRRAKESARRLEEIAQLKTLMISHIGVQGHAISHVSCGSVLDPSRKIIDVLDSFESLDVETAACMADVSDADVILEGVRRSFNDGDTVADVLDAHVHGHDNAEIARWANVDESVVCGILDRGLKVLDGIGVAHLRAATDSNQ